MSEKRTRKELWIRLRFPLEREDWRQQAQEIIDNLDADFGDGDISIMEEYSPQNWREIS